jgi:hypothetical protein
MTPAVLLAYNPNDVKPGWIALVLVLVLCAVTTLLWRSMNTQLRKIQLPAKPGRPPLPQASGPDRPVARPRPASPLPQVPPAATTPPEHLEWPPEAR